MGQTQPGGHGVTGLSRLILTVNRGMTPTDSQAVSELGLALDRSAVMRVMSQTFYSNLIIHMYYIAVFVAMSVLSSTPNISCLIC